MILSFKSFLLRYQLSIIGNNIRLGIDELNQINNLFIIIIVILTLNLIINIKDLLLFIIYIE